MNMRRIRPTVFAAVALAALAGCGKEEMAEVFKKGGPERGAGGFADDGAGEGADPTGGPVRVDARRTGEGGPLLRHAGVVSVGSAERAAVSSCKEAGDESFPSVLFRAEVSAGTLAELSGQKLAAQLYVQTEAEGPVWHLPEGQSVEVSITTAGEDSVEGELLGGTLVRTDTGQSTTVKGKFTGSLR